MFRSFIATRFLANEYTYTEYRKPTPRMVSPIYAIPMQDRLQKMN